MRLGSTSLPFANSSGFDAAEVVHVEAVEIVYQLFLGEVVLFSALLEVFVELYLILFVFDGCEYSES